MGEAVRWAPMTEMWKSEQSSTDEHPQGFSLSALFRQLVSNKDDGS